MTRDRSGARQHGGRVLYGGKRAERRSVPGGLLRHALHRRGGERLARSSSRKRSRRSLCDDATVDSTKPSRMHNDVPQGLSSAIFTNDLREAERFAERARQRLRHRQREHRHERRGNRRRVRRRKRNRRRTRKRQRCLEELHAAADRHGQLLAGPAARAGHSLRRVGPPKNAPAFSACRPSMAGKKMPGRGRASSGGNRQEQISETCLQYRPRVREHL